MLVRVLVMAATLALVVVGVAQPSASGTLTPELQCGVAPTSSVRLTHDLTCASSVVVDTTGTISIDLGGHTLTIASPDAPCVAGQPANTQPMCAIDARSAVDLSGGTVVGSVGLAAPSAGQVEQVVVRGDVWLSGGGGQVENSQIRQGTVYAEGAEDQIDSNVIHAGGISFDDTSNGLQLTISDNFIYNSPGAGIAGMLGGGGEFQNDVTGSVTDNLVFASNGAGIDFAGALTNFGTFAVSGNQLGRNQGDGIRIGGVDDPPTPFVGGPMTLSDNTASRNHGHGIVAGWVSNVDGTAIVDGGGNTAQHNALSPQCSGVSCS
jgi:hypothetical protein